MKSKLLRAAIVFWGVLLALLLGLLILSLTGVIHMSSFANTRFVPAELIREDTFDLRELSGLTIRGRAEGIHVNLVSGDMMAVRQYGNPRKDASFTDERTAASGGPALTLKIPNKSWFNWFNWGEKRLEIDLPASYAGDLKLSTVSGAVNCPGGFEVRTLALSSTSGRITLGASTADHLTLDTVSGGISMENVTVVGDVELDTTSGAIRAGDIRANNVKLDSVSGSIHAGTVALEGRAVIGTTSGSVRIGALSCRDYDIGSVSGRLSVETVLSGCGRLHTTSGGISAAGVALTGALTASTVSGSVTLSLAPGQNCDLQLSSTSGGLHGNVPLNYSGSRKHSATATVGAGGPLLSVSTTSGGITVNQ